MHADEAHKWGMINELIPQDQLMTRTMEVARMLAEGPPLVYAAIKEVLRETENIPFQSALKSITGRKLPTVDRLYSSDDQLEGARAFVEKRKPLWRGR